jgi:ATP-dependent helicase/nuclease subunit A
MPEFKATPAQQAAVESRGSALLVSAGAGSGKTRVLTERLMRSITDPERPVDLDRFLVITYTRAAAGELRSRIMKELATALAADPMNRRLRRQSALLHRAQIGTIHSFCAAFLRQHSHEARIGPDFAVLDEQRAGGMMARALEKVLDAWYDAPEKHPGFLDLADTVGAGRDDKRLEELVLELYGKMQSHARPSLWAQGQIRALEEGAEDAGDTAWGREILAFARETASFWAAEFERMLGLIDTEPLIAKAWQEGYTQTCDALDALCRALDHGWEAARACLPIPFKVGTLRKSPDQELSDSLKARRELCKTDMEKLRKLFAQSSEELLRDRALTAPAMKALLLLEEDFDRTFTAAKRRANLLDYADLEHLCA